MRRGFGWIWLLVTALIAGAAAWFSYQAGVAAGVASKLPAAAGGAVAPYWYGWYGPHFGFFLFPFFGLFWFLIVLFVIFAVVRAARHGGRGRWSAGIPPHLEDRLRDWHQQAHSDPPAPPAS